MDLCAALQSLRNEMPPIFAGTELDRYTGNGYRWRSLQNEKSLKKVPGEVFLRTGGRKLLIDRDRFLAHWQSKITEYMNDHPSL